jgi:FMN phosphatase YigB (HAD superfamily)
MSIRDRKERFAAILHEIDFQPPVEFVDELATTYKSALEIFLEAKPGAISLLKVSIITEGSQGTQEWTIEKLGFEVHFLATTNFFGVSEVDWIFGRVLEKLGLEAKNVVSVDDSEERDVIPARKDGIFTVHYSEKESVELDVERTEINTFWRLEHILRAESAQ